MNLLSSQWRLKTMPFLILVGVLASAAGCKHRSREEPQRTPQGEEHVRAIIQSLPADSYLRRDLEQGARGSGFHHPWMDAMKRQGIKRAEVHLDFNVPFHVPHVWAGRPGKFTAVRTLYFDNYDRDCSQITSPARLAALRESGLEQELQSYAREQAQNAPWFVFEHLPSTSRGVSKIDLMDDEWLPRNPSFLYPAGADSGPNLLDAVAAHDRVTLNGVLAAGKTPAATLDTGLMIAAYGPDSCMVKSLLQAGANANFGSQRGKTPLMFAAEQGMISNVKTLLQAGARVQTISQDGETALSLARGNHHLEVVALLERDR